MKRKSNGSNSNSPVTIKVEKTNERNKEEEEEEEVEELHGVYSSKTKFPYSKKVKPAVSDTRRT